MPGEPTIFQEAVSAFHKGEKARARDLLARLIKHDKDNPQYWLYMSGVVDTTRERIFCLKEVIRLDPGNETARRGLIYMNAAPADASLAIPLEDQRQDWETTRFQGPPPEKALQRAYMKQVMAMAGAVVGLVAIIAFIIFILNQPKPAAEPYQPAPAATPFPSLTIEPSPSLAPTPSPVSDRLLPLSALLIATYTPTPLSVNTPHPRTEAYRSAISAYARGDWQNAARYFQQVTTLEPNAPDVFYLLGEVNRFQGKYKEALQAYEQSIKINPNFGPAYLGRARTRLAQSPEPADPIRADLEKAVSLDPTLGEGYLELAALKIRKKETKDLQRDLDFAASLLPDSPQVFLLRAQFYLAQGKLETALQDANRAYELDITQLAVYRLLGDALRANNRQIDSIQPLETYTRYKTDEFEPFYWLAQAYLERNTPGDRLLALACLDQALKINNLSHDAHILRGEIYLDSNKQDEAYADFQLASMLRANSFEAMLGKGRAMLLMKDGTEAYNLFSRALQLASGSTERATALYWRAQGLENLGLRPAALADWQALLSLPAADVPALMRETALLRVTALATATPSPAATVSPAPSGTVSPVLPTLTPP